MPNRMSPVVFAETHFAGCNRGLYVDVRFHDKTEMNRLIEALIELRDTDGGDFDHVHLQQHGMQKSSVSGDAEIIFYRPGRMADEIENELIEEARNSIEVAHDPK